MKAARAHRYGAIDDIELVELADPVPKDGEVLVRIHAAGVNALDWRVVQGDPFIIRLFTGIRRPSKCPVLGADIAGTVEAVGPRVTAFAPGDAVFGEIEVRGVGGFSELGVIPVKNLGRKPEGMSFAEAAALPVAGVTAIQSVRDWGEVTDGQRVAVTGASGGVGTFTVQIAKAWGATVTAVTSTPKIDFVRQLGADEVVDRAHKHLADRGARFDTILDCQAPWPLKETMKAVRPGGTYVTVGGTGPTFVEAMVSAPWRARRAKVRFVQRTAKPSGSEMDTLAKLYVEGRLQIPIDRTYPLAETAKAIAHVASGRAQGKTVVIVRGESGSERAA